MNKKIYKKYFLEIFKLALPVSLGHLGHVMANITDAIMVGRISSIQLAAAAFSSSVAVVFVVLGVGIATGLTPLIGKAYGELNFQRCRYLLRHGFLINTILAIILSIVMYFSILVFDYFKQPPEIIRYSIPFFKLLSLSIIPYMMFLTFKQFLDGLGLTKYGMIVNIFGNILNIGLNYLLIYGEFGFPRLELEGAGYATLISRISMPFMIVFLMFLSPKLRYYIKFKNLFLFNLKLIYEIIKIGFPIGIQFMLEIAAFNLGAIMVGWFGTAQLAAHQIAMNLASLTYLIASGISAAATIKISQLLGEKKFSEMRIASNCAFFMSILLMLICGICLISGRYFFPSLYTTDIQVIRVATVLIFITALFELFDGIQVTALGILRGLHDVKTPTVIVLIAYWAVMLPACYLFSIQLDMQAAGIWIGYLVGLIASSCLLFLRYSSLIKNHDVATISA